MSSILKLEMNCNEMVEEYNILQSQCHWRLWVRLHNVWQTMVRFRPYFFTAKQHWWPIFNHGGGGWFWIAWREKSCLWKENSLLQIAKLKGLGTPLVSVAGWCVSSSGTQTDSDGGVVTLVTARVTARPALVSCARCGRRGGAGPSLYTNIGHLLCLTSIY